MGVLGRQMMLIPCRLNWAPDTLSVAWTCPVMALLRNGRRNPGDSSGLRCGSKTVDACQVFSEAEERFQQSSGKFRLRSDQGDAVCFHRECAGDSGRCNLTPG